MIDKTKYRESKPFEVHNLQFDTAAGIIHLEPWISEKIKYPRVFVFNSHRGTQQ